jgi:hypothetical protein
LTVLRKLVGNGDVAKWIGLDISIASSEAKCWDNGLAHTSAQEKLLPVFTKICTAKLGFEMEAPGTIADGVISDVIRPEIVVRFALIRGCRDRQGEGNEAEECVFQGRINIEIRAR